MRNHFQDAMRSVKVNKKDLIDKLKKNRSGHQAEFEAALEGYWKALNARLEVMLAQAKRHDPAFSPRIDLQKPENHIKEYDQAIDMLEWEQDEAVVLSAEDFRRYVRDDWDWQEGFKMLNSTYSA